MAGTVAAVSFVLAAVLSVAGTAKLLDREGSRTSLRGFGVPAPLLPVASVLLPVTELAIAAVLLASPGSPWGGLAAAALFLIFAAGVGAGLARGREVDCHCFGRLHSAPAGPGVVIRNLVLAALAIFAAAGAGRLDGGILGELASMPATTALALGLAGLAFAAAWAILELLRQQGRLLLRLEALEAAGAGAGGGHPHAGGLAVGATAPGFELEAVEGPDIALADLLGAQPLLLMFMEPGCGPCGALIPEVGEWQRSHPERLRFAVITRDDDRTRHQAQEHALRNVLLQEGRELSDAYLIAGTPSAVLIDAEGRIAAPTAGGADAIRELVARRTRRIEVVPTSAAGIDEPAPEFKLELLDGGSFGPAELAEESTALLFWSPSCGFCNRMLTELRAWDARRAPADPRLVVATTGSADDASELGLQSIVALDPDRSAARAFGAGGTPMAVLVDHGRVASPMVAGADRVMDLLRATAERSPSEPEGITA